MSSLCVGHFLRSLLHTLAVIIFSIHNASRNQLHGCPLAHGINEYSEDYYLGFAHVAKDHAHVVKVHGRLLLRG